MPMADEGEPAEALVAACPVTTSCWLPMERASSKVVDKLSENMIGWFAGGIFLLVGVDFCFCKFRGGRWMVSYVVGVGRSCY
jgi:hypothetical protein